MTPEDYCQQKAARSGSSFYYSFLFLPEAKRRAITALYAMCRELDDIVDQSTDPELAATRLAWWRGEISRLFAGEPQHPVTRALWPHVGAFGIDPSRLNEIVDGMQMDLCQDHYQDYEGLKLYCHRVAGVVGSLSAGIFSDGRRSCVEYAERLGLALQLTNIIRDVGEDARRGRVYLPADELDRFGIARHQLLALDPPEGFTALMRFQAARAREAYRAAFAALPADEMRAQRPGLVMAAIYATLLDEIESSGFPVLHGRVALTPLRKLWIAWRTWSRGRPPPVGNPRDAA